MVFIRITFRKNADVDQQIPINIVESIKESNQCLTTRQTTIISDAINMIHPKVQSGPLPIHD